MMFLKKEIDSLKGKLEVRFANLLGVLNLPANQLQINKGSGKYTRIFKPGTIVKIRKVEYDLIIEDLITVLKQLKGLKI